MTRSDGFLAEVEAFIALSGMKDSGFGRRALGDGNLLREMRRGRRLSFRTKAKCRAFMAQEVQRWERLSDGAGRQAEMAKAALERMAAQGTSP